MEEIVAVLGTCGDGALGRRLRGLIVILWRAGLRIQEALNLAEGDLDHRRGALLVRRGRRREVGMDAWAWEELHPWLELRVKLPVGPLFCVINGPTRGRHWSSAAARAELRRTAADRHPAPARPHQPCITSVYLQGIDNAEIIGTVHARRAPMVPVNASLRL